MSFLDILIEFLEALAGINLINRQEKRRNKKNDKKN
jgi:hypothetical protein